MACGGVHGAGAACGAGWVGGCAGGAGGLATLGYRAYGVRAAMARARAAALRREEPRKLRAGRMARQMRSAGVPAADLASAFRMPLPLAAPPAPGPLPTHPTH